MRFSIFIFLMLFSFNGYSQNLDLEEGFYPIVEESHVNSRQMLLRGDSALVYYIADKPIISKSQITSTGSNPETDNLYFYYDEEGTRALLEFTTHHKGDQLGFVYLGSLLKVVTVIEVVDNGVIELMANELRKVNVKREWDTQPK